MSPFNLRSSAAISRSNSPACFSCSFVILCLWFVVSSSWCSRSRLRRRGAPIGPSRTRGDIPRGMSASGPWSSVRTRCVQYSWTGWLGAAGGRWRVSAILSWCIWFVVLSRRRAHNTGGIYGVKGETRLFCIIFFLRLAYLLHLTLWHTDCIQKFRATQRNHVSIRLQSPMRYCP